MNQPDCKGPPAELEQTMFVIVFVTKVNVHMLMGLIAVFVNMCVNLHSLFSERAPGGADSKSNQHDRNRGFHPRKNLVGNRHSQENDHQPDAKQRERMTKTPESTNQR